MEGKPPADWFAPRTAPVEPRTFDYPFGPAPPYRRPGLRSRWLQLRWRALAALRSLQIALTSVALFGCAHATPVASPRVTFPTDEARLSACLDLRDHIVDLYVDDYLAEHNASLSPLDHEAFTVGWREELAKRGTFDRFEQTCFAGLTPSKLRCGMAATAPEALEACMKLDAR